MSNTYAMGKVFYDLGSALIKDDIKDLGWFSYKHRQAGDPHIGWGTGRHDSPIHHWQHGSWLVFLGQVLGALGAVEEITKPDEEESPYDTVFPRK